MHPASVAIHLQALDGADAWNLYIGRHRYALKIIPDTSWAVNLTGALQ
jgi:hypothetical protein